MLGKKEEKFYRKIDCNFPYNKVKEGYSLIDEASLLSEYCLYLVLYELLNTPQGEIVDQGIVMDYMEYIEKKLRLSFREYIMPFLKKLLCSKNISEKEVLFILSKSDEYIGYYVILNILLFSIDDKTGNISKKIFEIQDQWSRGKEI